MKNKKGKLILVATPIEELGELKPSTKELLVQASSSDDYMIAVEDPKPARRRWLHWGLPRAAIEKFVYYNEHQQINLLEDLLQEMKQGKAVLLLSDGGLPAFCDPGRSLVFRCHEEGVSVEATSFDNSLVLAVALSGFTEGAFNFMGFPPKANDERKAFFHKALESRDVCVFMDTPYRLERCVSEMALTFKKSEKRILLAMDMGRETFQLEWGRAIHMQAKKWGKREFVCVIEGQRLV